MQTCRGLMLAGLRGRISFHLIWTFSQLSKAGSLLSCESGQSDSECLNLRVTGRGTLLYWDNKSPGLRVPCVEGGHSATLLLAPEGLLLVVSHGALGVVRCIYQVT